MTTHTKSSNEGTNRKPGRKPRPDRLVNTTVGLPMAMRTAIETFVVSEVERTGYPINFGDGLRRLVSIGLATSGRDIVDADTLDQAD